MCRDLPRCFPTLLLALALAISVAPTGHAQNLLTEQQKLLVSDGVAGDEAGRKCSIDGDLAAIGAPYDDHSGLTDAGAVILMRRNGNQWVEETKIIEPIPVAANRFGWSLELSDQRLIVTSIPNASVFGSAYIYTHASGTWQLEATLAVGATGGYGYGAALCGNLAIVGAYVANTVGTATIYRYTKAAGWRPEQTLRAPDGANSDWFGLTVAIDDSSAFGEAALVAAQFHDALGANAGAAYLFRRVVGGAWVLEQKLMASDGVAGDAFGIGLDLGRDLAVIAAWPKDDGATDSGATYGYRRLGGSWVEEKLVPSVQQAFGYFGSGVSVDQGVVVVGSLGISGSGGRAFVFNDCGGQFVEQHQLLPDVPGGSQLGFSCDVDGQSILVGGPKDDDLGADAGAAYIYEISPLSLSTPPWSVMGGDPLTFASCGGPPGGLGILFVTDLNGLPLFLKLLNAPFDAAGHWSLTSPVSNDPNLPGNTLGFRMLTIWPGTGLLQSNDSFVEFQ